MEQTLLPPDHQGAELQDGFDVLTALLLAVAVMAENSLLEGVKGEEAEVLHHVPSHRSPHCLRCSPPLGLWGRGRQGMGCKGGVGFGIGVRVRNRDLGEGLSVDVGEEPRAE